MKTAAILLASILLVAAVPSGALAAMYYLVQKDGETTIGVLGNYSTLEGCLAELKKEKARGTTGLQCTDLSGSGGSATEQEHSRAGYQYLVGRFYGRVGDYIIFGEPRAPIICQKVKDQMFWFAHARDIMLFCWTKAQIDELKRVGATFTHSDEIK